MSRKVKARSAGIEIRGDCQCALLPVPEVWAPCDTGGAQQSKDSEQIN